VSACAAALQPQPVRFIGRSAAIRAVEEEAERAARSGAKILITGETGVGKEVVARFVHRRSTRAAAPLVTVNCAGLPDTLLESELFGHVRGSFTGAYRDKPGLLEMAPNGTVFLDEVGEMSPRMQVVLLRFLESGEIQRVGADRAHKRVNVRLLTATNRDLQSQIASGAFREDLYFRLNVIQLMIPPLRERADDIPSLVEFFLHAYGQAHQVTALEVSAEAMSALVAYRWPGNIRELKNIVARSALQHAGDGLQAISGLSAQARLPLAVPALPGRVGRDPAADRARGLRSPEVLRGRLQRIQAEGLDPASAASNARRRAHASPRT
jgi:anaerobic nitric oxide reductase transcription regulator